MSVKLILLEDVADLGKIGDEVHVANGYARNYLLPLKKAELLTINARRRVEAKKLRLQKEHEERVAVAQAMADKIAALTLTIPVAAGENDKLYGSVSGAQIAAALLEQGIEIDRNVVDLAEPIRELGSFEVDIKLHAEVTAKAKVIVTRADA
ncbi:MAG: 50S ribosomal protein L9 [Lentisphaeria bacterium]|nr:50S ribosomal protein L9 [Victivallales bacterium]MCR4576145.1 50S ribosomal protein L9 [Lentisphaeria bacterium]